MKKTTVLIFLPFVLFSIMFCFLVAKLCNDWIFFFNKNVCVLIFEQFVLISEKINNILFLPSLYIDSFFNSFYGEVIRDIKLRFNFYCIFVFFSFLFCLK